MAKSKRKIEIIVTTGPSTSTEADLRVLKERGVDFVRVNMSHSSIQDLKSAIGRAEKVGIPFIVDTEGSQVRTGPLKGGKPLDFEVGDIVRLHNKSLPGTLKDIAITPSVIVNSLKPGDLLYCDFESLVLSISDVSIVKKGFISARVVSGGRLGSNKGVYVDTAGRDIKLPTLTKKDLESIKIGLKHKVGHIAASFMRSGKAVRDVRKATKGKMKIISKIECIDGLRNLDEIIKESDALLIDRGDLSKEIFLNRIPFTQKIIVNRARKKGKPVVVATNFLESMVHKRLPTRAEIHDIESSITDGANGLTLAAETAIGEYPFESLSTMKYVIDHVTSVIDADKWASKEDELVAYLEKQNYLLDFEHHSLLINPHGGRLINRFKPELMTRSISSLPHIKLSSMSEMDVEQLALGSFSPLEGFMTKKELKSVLKDLRLPSGVIWPIPITLSVSEKESAGFKKGDTILLKDAKARPLALLHLTEKYKFNKDEYAGKLYGTLDERHPGVRRVKAMGDVFLAGPVDLLRRRETPTGSFELTPSQTRRLFESLGWERVIGFHTRNVIHRGHEYIQMKALEEIGAHGLFVHPVVGKKKPGDFLPEYIATSYDIMIREFYPKNKVLFAAMPMYSRYAGPKEALFTAIVRQNFGCSHFIVGRDHTGVGDFYHPEASHKIFDKFPDLGIKPIRFNKVLYSKKSKSYVHETNNTRKSSTKDLLHISGTQARKILESGKPLPKWFMRQEISQMILNSQKRGKKIFES